jgi:prepilin-type N-terminal cleavage/methylation domain-containing protein
MQTTHGAKRGLTLIEVLLAVVILAGGLTILLTGAARCLAAVKLAEYYQKAQWALGRGEAEHPMLSTVDCAEWEVPPTDMGEGFTFARYVECGAAGRDPADRLATVRCRVAWSTRGHESFEEVVRYVLLRKEAQR